MAASPEKRSEHLRSDAAPGGRTGPPGSSTRARPSTDVAGAGRDAFAAYPRSVLAQPPQLAFISKDCRAWDVPQVPDRTPTTSAIPTLVLSAGLPPPVLR